MIWFTARNFRSSVPVQNQRKERHLLPAEYPKPSLISHCCPRSPPKAAHDAVTYNLANVSPARIGRSRRSLRHGCVRPCGQDSCATTAESAVARTYLRQLLSTPLLTRFNSINTQPKITRGGGARYSRDHKNSNNIIAKRKQAAR